MGDSGSNIPIVEPTNKRRKVRKGTQSCWECKKRKVRCIFAPSTNTVCDNCIRRKTICISQKYIDNVNLELPRQRDERGMEARLSRVEDVLQQLLEKTEVSRSPRRATTQDHTQRVTDFPNSQDDTDLACVLHSGSMLSPTDRPCSSQTSLVESYTGLARELVRAWPPQADLEHFHKFRMSFSTHSHVHLSTPASVMARQGQALTSQILELPPPGCSPVLIAKKLLQLASFMQGAFSTEQTPAAMRKHFQEVQTRAFDTATRLVTTDDRLTASVEGIECIMIEALVHNYSGDLHRAWMAVRRAAAVAQVIGLHRGLRLPAFRFIEPESRVDFDPDVLCFRIVEMDRYLSMTLGLPPSSLETRTLTPEALAECEPIDRMARLQCIIAERLLRYDHRSCPGPTSEFLDEMEISLQQAASEMSSQWWLIPDLAAREAVSCESTFKNTVRINYQFSHYHLVMRLHLPHMLGSSEQYSKLAAANAGRETLSRYTAFRRWNTGQFYCRGVDYVAFVALTVLCLAHINLANTSTRHPPPRDGMHKILAQSHRSDRGLMENTLHLLKNMENDGTASRLARIMQDLLDIELDAANGANYNAVAISNSDGPAEYDGTLGHSNNTLTLCIPYFGKIILRQDTAPRTSEPDDQPHDLMADQQNAIQWDYQHSRQQTSPLDDAESGCNLASLAGDVLDMDRLYSAGDWTLQNINESLFTSLFGSTGDWD